MMLSIITLVFTRFLFLISDTNMNIREDLNFQKSYLELLKSFSFQHIQLPAKRGAKSVKCIARIYQLREFFETFSIAY